MQTTVAGRALLIAVESERVAEAFEEAALEEPDREGEYLGMAQTLREQAQAVRLSV